MKAVEILKKDLKLFESFNESLFKEITHLLTLRNFRYKQIYLQGELLDVFVLLFSVIVFIFDFLIVL